MFSLSFSVAIVPTVIIVSVNMLIVMASLMNNTLASHITLA